MKPMTRADILAQIADAKKTMAHLAKHFPGCFDSQGRAIVASAHFPLPQKRPTP